MSRDAKAHATNATNAAFRCVLLARGMANATQRQAALRCAAKASETREFLVNNISVGKTQVRSTTTTTCCCCLHFRCLRTLIVSSAANVCALLCATLRCVVFATFAMRLLAVCEAPTFAMHFLPNAKTLRSDFRFISFHFFKSLALLSS